jgi:MATE family multidrug resistance protein
MTGRDFSVLVLTPGARIRMNCLMAIGIRNLTREGSGTLILALPLVVGQVSQMLMGLADTLMIGRLGTVQLAASAFANNVLHLPFMFGVGMSIAVSVRVSQARGANEPDRARAALRHGLYICLGLGLLTMLLAFALLPVFPYFGQEEEVIKAVPVYFLTLALSMTPAMAAMAVKNHSDAMNRPWPAFGVIFAGVLLNVFLNWVFIYGNLGAPRWELEGAGFATLLARAATFAGLIILCVTLPGFRDWVPRHWFRPPEWPAVRRLVKIGLPASIQIFAEVSAFVAATLVIGSLGTEALASHQVAITCAATVFMVPLGVSMALTVRIGEAWGAKEFVRWRAIVVSGWGFAVTFTLFSAGGFLIFRHDIAAGFLTEPEAAALTASLLIVAAAFQMSDSLQIISAGCLRGLNDVNIPAGIAFFAYWVIALPLGWFLTFHGGMGVHGMWWGITLGLTLTSIFLGVRIWLKTGPSKWPKEAQELG